MVANSSNYSSTNDAPTLNDIALGTKPFIAQLANNIRHAQPPKTYAITGYWGAGKTSALAMLFKELTGQTPPGFAQSDESKKDSDFEGIWFEAWRYQHEPVPIVALLQTIKRHFSTTAILKDKAGKMCSIAFLGALTVFDNVIKTATGLSGFDKLQGVGDKYEKDNLSHLLATDQINEYLTKAVNVILNEEESDTGSKRKLVIFIDDLDRCEPQTAYRLLEGLKLYLNIPNCLIVMAIDPQQIEASLRSKLASNNNEDPQSRFYAVEYMEKLCQDAYRLPVPDMAERNQFLLTQLKPLMTGLTLDEQTYVEDLKSALVHFDCLPANPRRLKMLANRMVVFFAHTDPTSMKELVTLWNQERRLDEIYVMLVLAVASMSVNYRRLYERIEKCSTFEKELFDFCDAANQNLPKYSQPLSVFYEFDKATTNTESLVAHPSDLGVFRLACLFSQGPDSLTGIYQLTPPQVGEIMHQIIVDHKKPPESDKL